MNYWDKILDGFDYISKGGAPDFSNPNDKMLLRMELLKKGWNENAVNELLYNLTEKKDEKDDSWWTKMSPNQQQDYIKRHPKSQKAIDAKKEKEKKDKKQKSSKQTKELNDVDKDFYDRDVEPSEEDYQKRVEAGQVTNAGLKDEGKRITRDSIAKFFPPGAP